MTDLMFFFLVKWAVNTDTVFSWLCMYVFITVPRLHVLTYTEGLSTKT